MTELRVVIADDHHVFRMGLHRLLDSVPGVSVVAEAADTAGTVAAVREHDPDVAIIDLHMPGGGGVDATEQIRRHGLRARVLVLTMHSDHVLVRQAVRAGARGYLLKDAEPDEIIGALRAVHADQAIFDSAVADRMLATLGETGPATPFPQLTEREFDILGRMAAGQSNQAIAARIGISVKTVQNHVSNILLKLGVADRAQAVAKARDAGVHRPG
ncbi:DNA-binding response regulator, NarL/FixJ family, contains REC and HTH domains [Micromonospora viridifaciens]|uniref:DNA-binding response regulator, NarL/FixJ family, contains REC and HTH domains n=1 Tax=Micromonospora viridifaciens TaxID=1881 RepID=A0A1C4ZM19_MICVI|nr:response regulator transcription factor [Micromonospora viridifaciens]SCF34120.1 DNA-binding response regulator, NarL/FixJ family, contains REC and HTH domains [Micromonospora viridifaciens]